MPENIKGATEFERDHSLVSCLDIKEKYFKINKTLKVKASSTTNDSLLQAKIKRNRYFHGGITKSIQQHDRETTNKRRHRANGRTSV